MGEIPGSGRGCGHRFPLHSAGAARLCWERSGPQWQQSRAGLAASCVPSCAQGQGGITGMGWSSRKCPARVVGGERGQEAWLGLTAGRGEQMLLCPSSLHPPIPTQEFFVPAMSLSPPCPCPPAAPRVKDKPLVTLAGKMRIIRRRCLYYRCL